MLISSLIYLYLVTIFVSFKYLCKSLYFYQAVGYNVKRLFFMYRLEKRSLLFFIINFLQMITGAILFCFNINKSFTFITYILIFILSLFYIFYSNLNYELKFTNRIKRFIFSFYLGISLIFILLYFCLLNLINFYLFLGFYNILLFLIFFINLIFMLFLECLLSLRYIIMTRISVKKSKIKYNIAITGSFGKTSVKNILYTILSEKFNICVTPKNYNTIFGICKTVKNLNNNHNMFLFEFGANKKNDIKKLSNLVNPNIGCITNVGYQHLETFGSIKSIYNTKKELVDYIEKINGDVIFNLENEYTRQMYFDSKLKKLGVCFYSNYQFYKSENAIIYSAKIINLNETGCEFEIYENDKYIGIFKTQLLGEHNILNILFAVAVARKLNFSYLEISTGIKKIKQVQNRLQVKKLQGGGTLIDDSYNSNFVSFNCALKVLSFFKNKKKIIITPGIIELKEKQYELNYKLGKEISKICDEVFIVKEVNKEALLNGLIDNNFLKENIHFISKIDYDFLKEINQYDEKNVVLIENDLPNLYK